MPAAVKQLKQIKWERRKGRKRGQSLSREAGNEEKEKVKRGEATCESGL